MVGNKNNGRHNILSRLARAALSPVLKKTQRIGRIIFAAFLLFCIVAVMFVSMLLLAHPFPSLGILFSTVFTVFLSVPLTITLLPLFASASLTYHQAEKNMVISQQEKIADLEKENVHYKNAQEEYKSKIRLLENLTFNMGTYSDVFKFCFRDYKQGAVIKQHETYNYNEKANVFRKITRPGTAKTYSEIVSIMDCLVTYQRGLDLKNVRIAKVNDSTVVISGVQPVFTSEPRFEYKDFFSEIRKISLDKNDEVLHISVEGDADSSHILAKKQAEYKASFEDSFLKGNDSDSAELTERAKDWLTAILRPLYRHVQFSDDALAQDSLPLLEHLNRETALYQNLLKELPDENHKKS